VRIFKWPNFIFAFFVIISPLKKTQPFIWTNLNSLYPKIICSKFDWNWLANKCQYFSLFCCYLSLVKGYSLHLNKLESPPQGWFVTSLVKIGPVVLEKKSIMWKVNRRTVRRTDTRRTTGDRKSSLELS
jgi:hypothetical protein